MNPSLSILRALLAAAAVSVLLNGCTVLEVAHLNRIELTEFKVVGERLYIANEINARSLDQFNEVMTSAPQVKTLVLSMVPGSVDDEINLQLGLEVRKRGLNTHLVSGGMVASGGTDLFLAGVERTIEHGAYVGVHTWATGFRRTGDDVPRDDPSHRQYLDYYEAIGIDPAFYWFTLEAAPAGEMYWMRAEELDRFKMITRPLIDAGETLGPFQDQLRDFREEIESGEGNPPRSVSRGLR